MIVATIALAAASLIYFLCSVLAQYLVYPSFQRYVERHVVLSAALHLRFLPRWTFFAPNPPQGDYVILCRSTSFHQAKWGEWTTLSLYDDARSWPGFLWSPSRRFLTASTYYCSRLTKVLAPEMPSVWYSTPYLTILAMVIDEGRVGKGELFQFCVVSMERLEVREHFCSSVHLNAVTG